MKRRNTTVKFISVFLCGALLFLGCAKEQQDEEIVYESEEETEISSFDIAILHSEADETFDDLFNGFSDSVSDNFGDNEVSIKFVSKRELLNPTYSEGTDLIIAGGDEALTFASEFTEEIPVIGVDVTDFKRVLRIHDTSWNGKTGTNVTGVSDRPPISSALSLMIEADTNLSAVGIIYSGKDKDSIYENEILEGYLNEAGIPWKEYEIPYEDDADAEGSPNIFEPGVSYAIHPDSVSALSSKEGPVYDVASIGEPETITGLNADNAVRMPKTSANWVGTTHPSASPAPVSQGEGLATLQEEGLEAEDGEEPAEPEISAAEQVIREAASECDNFFISSGTYLSDVMDLINSISVENGICTTTCDNFLMGKTLTCLYSDTYAQGYEAGKIAKKILLNDSDPGNIKINGAKTADCTKLYCESIRKSLNHPEFPKSFRECTEFMESYVPGETTEREVE